MYGNEWIFRDEKFSMGLDLETNPIVLNIVLLICKCFNEFSIVMLEKGLYRSFALAELVCVSFFVCVSMANPNKCTSGKVVETQQMNNSKSKLEYFLQVNCVHCLLTLIL